jgi:AcrR family transcriptional regulator
MLESISRSSAKRPSIGYAASHPGVMQQIIDECGCGKNLLYREFASKDHLVAAYLERCQQEWTAIMHEATEHYGDDAAGQLVAMVRAVARQVEAPDFRGCPFRVTHAEFPDEDHPAHQVSVRHVKNLRTWLRSLARRAGAGDQRALADRIMLIIDGLYVNGAMLGRKGATTEAVALAEEWSGPRPSLRLRLAQVVGDDSHGHRSGRLDAPPQCLVHALEAAGSGVEDGTGRRDGGAAALLALHEAHGAGRDAVELEEVVAVEDRRVFGQAGPLQNGH